jgi:hypothetical protein
MPMRINTPHFDDVTASNIDHDGGIQSESAWEADIAVALPNVRFCGKSGHPT